ncbi:hypothetical protein YC2023_011715 [Brassica napus]
MANRYTIPQSFHTPLYHYLPPPPTSCHYHSSSPLTLFTPPPAVTTTPTSSPNNPAGFSTHFSTPNAFAATAVLKGSTSAFPTTPSSLIDEEQKSEHGVGKLSDSSPDKTV